jgi:lon-related putative ATP-dependent protease
MSNRGATTMKPLPPESLYRRSDPAAFPFRTTAELEPLEEVIGQHRAVEAVRFAIGMRHRGYNLFAFGPQGTGKYSLVRHYLEKVAAEQPVPSDWCYVNNFAEPHKPRTLRLPPGAGRPLKADMERLVDDLRAAIPAVFESEEYRNRRRVIEEQTKERHDEAFGALQKWAQENDVALIRTPVGLALAPTKDGEVLNPEEFKALSEAEQERRKRALEQLQKELEAILRQIPRWEKEQREAVRGLTREVTTYAVAHLIEEVKVKWEDVPAVIAYLEEVRTDVIDNVDDFLPQERGEGETPLALALRERSARGGPFRRYQVNVLVDNSGWKMPGVPDVALADTACAPAPGAAPVRPPVEPPPLGAPVVDEDFPTQPNLVGRIEHVSQFGTLVTDFTLIKAGALHRANGGFLVLDALKVLMQPFAWETLKRALRSRRIRIETPGEAYGLGSTVTLEPEQIPLDLKVVLLGEPMLYYLLNHYDPDFRELFKVAADFDDRMERAPGNAQLYARLIATVAGREGLRPLAAAAVARVVEHGARLADDAEKLSTHMGSIVDLVREADYWAGTEGKDVVDAAHVTRAVEAKEYRSDRIRERIQEEIRRGTLVIETAGAKVGQINGLSVIQLDHFSFGRPSRISCRVRLGKGEVVDIEREVALGGPLHSKGVLILSSFLSTRFAERQPLSLSASLVFEQSYGGVEGDSASSAELYALLSALSGIPIRQSLAVTGSVDQSGRVQAIGGVNEKIEGFFDVCKARGLDGSHGVLVPTANVKHLMLREEVVKAAAAGLFHVYAVDTIDQGVELLTGVPAGEKDAEGEYPISSVNRAVALKLAQLARTARELAAGPGGAGERNNQRKKD